MQDGGVFAQFMNVTGITWVMNLLGVMDGPPELFKTRFATVVAMTHIQLPFTLLPIYSVMKTISPTYMRAAKSLGGTPFYSFIRVYMPQTLPGVAAGCLLTFILCLGYYITPALVGGPTDQMVSGFIASRDQHREQLGQGLGAGRHPAHRHADPLLRLQQAGRHRPHEAGLSAMAVPSYFTTGEKIAHYSASRLRGAGAAVPDLADHRGDAALLQLRELLHLSDARLFAEVVRGLLLQRSLDRRVAHEFLHRHLHHHPRHLPRHAGGPRPRTHQLSREVRRSWPS